MITLDEWKDIRLAEFNKAYEKLKPYNIIIKNVGWGSEITDESYPYDIAKIEIQLWNVGSDWYHINFNVKDISIFPCFKSFYVKDNKVHSYVIKLLSTKMGYDSKYDLSVSILNKLKSEQSRFFFRDDDAETKEWRLQSPLIKRKIALMDELITALIGIDGYTALKI